MSLRSAVFAAPVAKDSRGRQEQAPVTERC
jgi:hypothetical protein